MMTGYAMIGPKWISCFAFWQESMDRLIPFVHGAIYCDYIFYALHDFLIYVICFIYFFIKIEEGCVAITVKAHEDYVYKVRITD